MTHADVAFQGKNPDETFVFYFRQHWIRLFKPFWQMLAAAAVIGLAGFFLLSGSADPATRHLFLFILSLLFLLSQFLFVASLYRYFLYVFVVTDKKVHRIKKTLLAFDDHQNVDLSSLQNINKFQHGMIQNLLGFGTIILETPQAQVRIHFVPRIKDRHRDLMRLSQLQTPNGQWKPLP